MLIAAISNRGVGIPHVTRRMANRSRVGMVTSLTRSTKAHYSHPRRALSHLREARPYETVTAAATGSACPINRLIATEYYSSLSRKAQIEWRLTTLSLERTISGSKSSPSRRYVISKSTRRERLLFDECYEQIWT